MSNPSSTPTSLSPASLTSPVPASVAATSPGAAGSVASDQLATTTGVASPAPGKPLGDFGGREPFLYAGLGIMFLTIVLLRPLWRHRPDLRVRLGLPYLLTLLLIGYALEGSWSQALAICIGCMGLVFALTILRMVRWQVPAKPQVHEVPVNAARQDPYVAKIEPELLALGFEPMKGYRQAKPNGILEVLAYRHPKDPVVAQVRILRLGARRYPHLAFASRLRGQGQLWTWNLPLAAQPVPADWTTYQHAQVTDAKTLYELHRQHMAARPAVYVADSPQDTAKRLQALGVTELEAQANSGWLVAKGEHYRLSPKGVFRLSATALLAFLGIPLGPKPVQG